MRLLFLQFSIGFLGVLPSNCHAKLVQWMERKGTSQIKTNKINKLLTHIRSFLFSFTPWIGVLEQRHYSFIIFEDLICIRNGRKTPLICIIFCRICLIVGRSKRHRALIANERNYSVFLFLCREIENERKCEFIVSTFNFLHHNCHQMSINAVACQRYTIDRSTPKRNTWMMASNSLNTFTIHKSFQR